MRVERSRRAPAQSALRTTPAQPAPPDLADDVIWSAPAIGRHCGLSVSGAYRALSQGLLPARRVGSRYVARRSELDRFLRAGGSIEES
jgi:hypothetical protein